MILSRTGWFFLSKKEDGLRLLHVGPFYLGGRASKTRHSQLFLSQFKSPLSMAGLIFGGASPARWSLNVGYVCWQTGRLTKLGPKVFL